MKRVLCIWLPNWPVQRLVAARPELKCRPVVLHARDPRRGHLVAYSSTAARQLGIKPDMPVAEAEALLHHALPPQLLTEHQPQADLEELERVALHCEQFSSLVGLENAAQPSALLLEIAAIADRFDGEQQLSQRIVEMFQRWDWLVRIGVADTLGAAWAVAHCDPPHVPFTVPHIQLVPPAAQASALRPLPIEALRLAEPSMTLLHQLGVTRVDQLLQLPRGGLRARFGDLVLVRLDQALGKTAELIQTYRPEVALELCSSLEHPTDRREVIEQVLHTQLIELARRLTDQGRGAIQLECRLTSTQRRSITIQVGLYKPTSQAAHLFDLMRMQLEQKTLTAPIADIELSATVTSRMTDRQRALLGDVPHHAPEQLAHLVDRLSSRLGRQQVMTARLLAEPQPERAYHYEPLAGQTVRNTGGTRQAIAKNARLAGLRPLRLYPTPIPLRTIELAEAPDRTWTVHPAAFQHRGTTHRITHSWGPERIETGWWRGPTIRRDYYRVEDEHGSRFWIFRDLEQRCWFLHGF